MERKDVAVIDFIEAYHTKFGKFPRRAEIMQAALIADETITPAQLDAFLDNTDVNKSLDERGIVPPWQLDKNPVGLTEEQLAVAALLNNFNDRRSDEKKLRDLGISTRKFGGWMHSERFAKYMRESAEQVHTHSEHLAHKSLLHALSTGNVNATKLYFEMTGRYNPAHENQINVQAVMSRIVEIIQTHVHDVDTLIAIGADFQMLAVEYQMGNNTKAKELTSKNDPVAIEAPPVDKEFQVPPKGTLYI